MSEKWREIYSEKQLKKIQELEIEALKCFISICEKLNLEYIVYGGTMLGTIKYEGIVPWDDDVDVAMPRKDYMKFIKEASKILPDKYIIQTPYFEHKTPYSYTKMRIRGTKMIEKYYNKLDIEKGVYIDIYPIDNIPDDEKLRKKQFKNVNKWIKLYYYRQCLRFELKAKSLLKSIIYSLLYFSLRIIPQRYYIKKMDYYMTEYNKIKTKRKACLFSPNYNNIFIEFYPLVEKKFGDIIVKVPKCYEDHLFNRYGDYKKDLPDEKKIGHIPYEIEV